MKSLLLAATLSAPDPLQYRLDQIKRELAQLCIDITKAQSDQWDQSWITAKCDSARTSLDNIKLIGSVDWAKEGAKK